MIRRGYGEKESEEGQGQVQDDWFGTEMVGTAMKWEEEREVREGKGIPQERAKWFEGPKRRSNRWCASV